MYGIASVVKRLASSPSVGSVTIGSGGAAVIATRPPGGTALCGGARRYAGARIYCTSTGAARAVGWPARNLAVRIRHPAAPSNALMFAHRTACGHREHPELAWMQS